MERNIVVCWQGDFCTSSRCVYYGAKTRNEYRLTRFGRGFPFLQSEYVGSLLVLVRSSVDHYAAFVLTHDEDIEAFFDTFSLSFGETSRLIDSNQNQHGICGEEALADCLAQVGIAFDVMPKTGPLAAAAECWFNTIHGLSPELISRNSDGVLLGWVQAEYDIFRRIEENVYQPIYTKPFSSCQELIEFANTILNRRKSRAGLSLELHLRSIFDYSEITYEAQAITEAHKRPDFIFPSEAAYHDAKFPLSKLFSLAVKRTCKDRWRQVINEADRLKVKYLFTLQEGVSQNQLREMELEGVRLVVPAPNLSAFPSGNLCNLITLGQFLQLLRCAQAK